ncbi:hypothetical protein MLD38_007354 [Melastoma candidum]|uniref:Uncharacterized protein n=1 Tax=Melastoma candidum TaxID=119954 RepID=A0ACB9RS75_9MYRT|nr:hypothetical protein MLD38_007354 [Melastoma candidum]
MVTISLISLSMNEWVSHSSRLRGSSPHPLAWSRQSDWLDFDRTTLANDVHDKTGDHIAGSGRVFQERNFRTDDPRVSNIVVFSDATSELKVEAAAPLKTEEEYYLSLIGLPSLLSSSHSRCPTRYRFDSLGMRQQGGWTPRTCLNLGTSAYLEETRTQTEAAISIYTGKGVKEAIDKFISLREVTGDLNLVEGE